MCIPTSTSGLAHICCVLMSHGHHAPATLRPNQHTGWNPRDPFPPLSLWKLFEGPTGLPNVVAARAFADDVDVQGYNRSKEV